MTYTSTAPAPSLTTVATALVKPDRPRAIDHFIDYFGETAADLCGEELLDQSAGRDFDQEGAASSSKSPGCMCTHSRLHRSLPAT
jgi:hypothetical protein